MELTFQNYPYHYLKNIVQDTKYQEETAEVIVPDSYPDIAMIINCSADAVLRGKDCRDGGITVAGGVKGAILYMPEDQSYPRNLEMYIPFSVKIEHPSLTTNSQIICSVRIRSVDSRMINSRKAMIRVNLCCEISAYERAMDEHYELSENVPYLETRETSFSAILPREVSERFFSLNEVLELPAGKPGLSQTYKFHCRPDLTDEKLIGNKAVFKGVLRCKLLYLSEDGTLNLHQENLPFSQYCELNGEYDEENLLTQVEVTGYDMEATALEDKHRLPVAIHLLAQCIINGNQSITMIDDAYCTNGELHPLWKEYPFDGCLDQQRYMQAIRQHVACPIREVLDTNIYLDHPEVNREGDKATIKIPAVIYLTGYDESGVPLTVTSKAEVLQELPLSDQASCHVSASIVGEIFIIPDSCGTEIRFAVQIFTACYSKEKLITLCGGEIEEMEADAIDRPAVIIRTVDAETSLWEIAKYYKTTVADIQAANQLETVVVPETRMLLLPMQ